ncbi:5'-nucleotidase C-terminal domain-containing protein [Tissierella sp. Yu-01]|uniref:5'-nucleotidase C-terminal domain-containing protein n=1 Tax=Tissierella sp. Yu-01 TaxID=3035694 RepID=UPI00240E53B0|nr:5'-nucleotidase C-terminal domain-containing protein [Tissierella sp. Yu-01]WFA08613.1 5'-nucleotidase C-terminal domain-containing protein [Tissierella sp. Yu-01]
MFKNKRLLSLAIAFLLVFGIIIAPTSVFAEGENVKLTIIGTTDLHANIYNYSYEDGKEVDNLGMAKVYSVIQEIRADNPNTILVDNGDTIQGTILSDDLYNTKLEEKHPVIDVMNFMGYDSMTLGNHEFNFGLELVDKIAEEAEFSILAANATYKKDGSYLVEPYLIKEVAGIKVGILGITNPNIARWDGTKVESLQFDSPVEATEKHIEEMKEKGADIIFLSTHMGYTSEYGGDGADEVIVKFPEVAGVLTGHAHVTEEQKVGNTLVGAAKNAGAQVVRFDYELAKENDAWTVVDSSVKVIDVTEYPASEELKEYAKEYHDTTLEFLQAVIGTVTENFAPESEIPGIPEAQLIDTGLIDLINDVQLKYTEADVSGAALFSQNSNLRAGDVTYASIFEIYKYPNTLVAVEVTGAELKDYMEWSAAYYNTFKPGDINISFNPDIRVYNYDMFQGVDYKIDLSKPAGERIVDLMFKGEPVKADDTFKLAVNNYRHSGLQGMGIIKNDPYFNSDPKSLRSFIADYIAENSPIAPVTDNNWEIINADLDHPLREYLIEEIKAGNITLPVSEDGRSINAKAINADEMIAQGLIPEELTPTPEPIPEPTPAPAPVPVEPAPAPAPVEPVKEDLKYVVQPGDWLSKIGIKYNVDWKVLADYNKIANPNLIFPNQIILIPAN